MIPSQAQIDAIPKSRCGEFELSDKECQTLRSRLYSINKDGLGGIALCETALIWWCGGWSELRQEIQKVRVSGKKRPQYRHNFRKKVWMSSEK